MNNKPRTNPESLMKILCGIIIGVGILLRVVVYFQNRNLIIDEANIARNIFERGFAGLVQPLSYEQYAPPIFLWLTKLNSLLCGFSEYALRLYPLLAGIAALFVFYTILKQLVSWRSIWYALFPFAAAPIFIRYSSELKQYMPDVLIVLSLIWLALRTDIEKLTAKRFALVWIIAGSIAIWSSMPSVFVLTGVGAYYFLLTVQQKIWNRLGALLLVSAVWLLQFACYYLTILKPQANSSYLQNFHQYNFLFATPSSAWEWQQNWAVVNALVRQLGDWPFALYFNTILFLAACVVFFYEDKARGLLLLVPIVAVFAAAACNQYSLLPRVALFIIPIILLVIVYGLEQLYKIRNTAWQVVLTIIAVVYAISGNGIEMLWKPFKAEQLTEAMNYLKRKNIEGNDVTFYHSSGAALVYYTQIHPGKKEWQQYKNADVMKWDTSYDSLAKEMKYSWHITRPVGFVFTNSTEEQVRARLDDINKYLQPIDSLSKPYVRTYIFANSR